MTAPSPYIILSHMKFLLEVSLFPANLSFSPILVVEHICLPLSNVFRLSVSTAAEPDGGLQGHKIRVTSSSKALVTIDSTYKGTRKTH